MKKIVNFYFFLFQDSENDNDDEDDDNDESDNDDDDSHNDENDNDDDQDNIEDADDDNDDDDQFLLENDQFERNDPATYSVMGNVFTKYRSNINNNNGLNTCGYGKRYIGYFFQ